MSVNKHLPHVLVLPEDDANRRLANGFHLQIDWRKQRQMQVLTPAGGWNEVLNLFRSEHVRAMERYSDRSMVLLLDFDGRRERLDEAKAMIPPGLVDRVFVLGALSEPEDLPRAGLGSYETIGSNMARDCYEETASIWGHDLLRHNAYELLRLRERVRSILFS